MFARRVERGWADCSVVQRGDRDAKGVKGGGRTAGRKLERLEPSVVKSDELEMEREDMMLGLFGCCSRIDVWVC